MSTHHYYKVALPTLISYYNIIGIDINEIDFNTLETEVRDVSELSPFNYQDVFSDISLRIDKEMQTFIEKMCSYFGYSEKSLEYQSFYYEAFMGILKTTTSLNLIPDGVENYLLHFARLNEIILMTLYELNRMPVDEVIAFFTGIISQKTASIKPFLKKNSYVSLFTLLAMCPNADIEDYRMFEDDRSFEINYKNLTALVKENLVSDTDYEVYPMPFMRLSYKKSCDLSGLK